MRRHYRKQWPLQNFSRDVLEQNQTITTELIDFETIIETPQQEEKKAPRFINSAVTINYAYFGLQRKPLIIHISAYAVSH